MSEQAGKSKVAAILLAFFLGGIGIHNFYLGNKGKAIAQLLLGTVGWVIIFGPVIAGIWAFIEFIMLIAGGIKTDAQGNALV